MITDNTEYILAGVYSTSVPQDHALLKHSISLFHRQSECPEMPDNVLPLDHHSIRFILRQIVSAFKSLRLFIPTHLFFYIVN